MNLHCIVFGIMFTLVGVFFLFGKGINHMKGFDDIPEEERKEIDLQKLGRLVARVFLSAGLIFGVAGLNQEFLHSAFKWFMIAWFVLTGITVYFLTMKRYLHNQR